MMSEWTTLCTVQVTHIYWGGDCADLEFVIPRSMGVILCRARVLARSTLGKLMLLVELNDQGGARFSLAGMALYFGIRLVQPYLSNYTALAVRCPLYSNRGQPATLAAPVECLLTGSRLSVPVGELLRPAEVVVRDLSGASLRAESLAEDDARTEITLELSGLPAGRYTLETADSGGVEQRALILEPELAASGAFGLLELTPSDAPLAAPPALTLPLTALAQHLCFYVVAHHFSASDFALLSVQDAGAAEDNRAPIAFERVESSAFTDAELPVTLLGDSEDQIALFRSTDPLARQARGRKRLQLNKNGDVLIANLPQPCAQSSTSDIIVRVSKP